MSWMRIPSVLAVFWGVLACGGVWGEEVGGVTNAPAAQEALAEGVPATVVTNLVVSSEAVEAALSRLEPAVDALSARLGTLEGSLQRQQERAMESGKETMRMVLVVAGCFSGAVLVGVLVAAMILSRAVRRVSEVVTAGMPRRLLTAGEVPAGVLGGGGGELAVAGGTGTAVEHVTTRFLGVIEQLEKRIVELEHSARPDSGHARGNGHGSGNGLGGEKVGGGAYEFSVSALHQKQYPEESASGGAGEEVGIWLGKGQALLGLGQAAEALVCFDKAVELAPTLADAQVKRGMALEKLERLEDALASYDRAIQADSRCTLAYLHKGGICNRLQRYREAAECYESALKSEQRA